MLLYINAVLLEAAQLSNDVRDRLRKASLAVGFVILMSVFQGWATLDGSLVPALVLMGCARLDAAARDDG